MKDSKEIKLSSSWTYVGLFGGAILVLALAPMLIPIVKDNEFGLGTILAIIIFLAITGFLVYQFIYVCDARVIENQLVLKKLFKPAKSYTFDKIGFPSSFRIKRTKYITVEMKNEDHTVEKYLIINSSSILSLGKKNAEDILLDLRNYSKQNNN